MKAFLGLKNGNEQRIRAMGIKRSSPLIRKAKDCI